MTIDQTWQMCNNLDMTMDMPLTSWMGATWCIGDMTCTTYNHVSTPNTRTCASMSGGMIDGGLDGQHGGSASAHQVRIPAVSTSPSVTVRFDS